MDKLKIAGYIRCALYNGNEQDSTSIENQKQIIQDYVSTHFPDSNLDFYVDKNCSGLTFEERESYQKMRPLLMNKHYDTLIVKDLSRFSRHLGNVLMELGNLRNAGVNFISITDNIDFSTDCKLNTLPANFHLLHNK